MDTNKDGVITIEEFIEACRKVNIDVKDKYSVYFRWYKVVAATLLNLYYFNNHIYIYIYIYICIHMIYYINNMNMHSY